MSISPSACTKLYVVVFAGSILRAGTSGLIADAVVPVLIPVTPSGWIKILALAFVSNPPLKNTNLLPEVALPISKSHPVEYR